MKINDWRAIAYIGAVAGWDYLSAWQAFFLLAFAVLADDVVRKLRELRKWKKRSNEKPPSSPKS